MGLFDNLAAQPAACGNSFSSYPITIGMPGGLGEFAWRFPIPNDIPAGFVLLNDLLTDTDPSWGIPDTATGLYLWNGGSPHLIAWNFNERVTPIGGGLDGYGVIHPYRAQPGSPLILNNRESVLRLRLACQTDGASTFGMVIFTS